jgi:DNA-binding transcriptional regulator LsrR (DeoR family)
MGSVPPAQSVATLSSQRLLDSIQDGQRLALSWRTALQAMVWSVTASRQYDLEVVQLVGGVTEVTGQESGARAGDPRDR